MSAKSNRGLDQFVPDSLVNVLNPKGVAPRYPPKTSFREDTPSRQYCVSKGVAAAGLVSSETTLEVTGVRPA